MEIKYRGNPPIQATEGAAGMDLIADFSKQIIDWHLLEPGERALIPTGTYLEIPSGYVGMIAPRSGLAIKEGVTVLNAPGIIDSDYRGEISVILANLSKSAVTIKHGQRIAQLVLTSVPEVNLKEVEELSETARGGQGFGSTGK